MWIIVMRFGHYCVAIGTALLNWAVKWLLILLPIYDLISIQNADKLLNTLCMNNNAELLFSLIFCEAQFIHSLIKLFCFLLLYLHKNPICVLF